MGVEFLVELNFEGMAALGKIKVFLRIKFRKIKGVFRCCVMAKCRGDFV